MKKTSNEKESGRTRSGKPQPGPAGAMNASLSDARFDPAERRVLDKQAGRDSRKGKYDGKSCGHKPA